MPLNLTPQEIEELLALKARKKELEFPMQELQLINQINKAAITEVKRSELLDIILQACNEFWPAFRSRIYDYDSKTNRLTVASEIAQEPPEPAAAFAREKGILFDYPVITESSGIIEILHSGKAFITTDAALLDKIISEYLQPAEKQKWASEFREKIGINSIALVPLVSGNLVFGLLSMALPHTLVQEDIDRIDRIAQQASAVLGKIYAEEQRHKQAEFFETILGNIPMDIAVFNTDHQYIFLNSTAIKNEELRKWMIGKTDYDYCRYRNIPDTIATQRRNYFKKTLLGEAIEYVDEVQVKSEPRLILRRFYPILKDGSVQFVIGYGMDVTFLKKAEQQRIQHQQQLEEITFTTSHKIRQPIVNMQALFEVLKENDIPVEERDTTMQFLKDSIEQMHQLTVQLSGDLYQYKQQLK